VTPARKSSGAFASRDYGGEISADRRLDQLIVKAYL
jgi:hypothetical protein